MKRINIAEITNRVLSDQPITTTEHRALKDSARALSLLSSVARVQD